MSTNNELNLLALRVHAMRDAQREYFRAVGIAKRSHAGHDWKKADNALRHAKDLEAIVDHQVFNILKPNEQQHEYPARDLPPVMGPGMDSIRPDLPKKK